MAQERKYVLEIDKFQGAEFPPSIINVDDREYCLENIFLDANIKITIKTQETDITDPMGGQDGAYSEEELDNLMRAHRTSPTGNNMSAYLVIVNGIYFSNDPERYGPDPSTLGIMFDINKRMGTAVFHASPFIKSDDYAFFRTTMHELGHQFNLQHTDGASYMEDGSRRFTLMNQTWVMRRHKTTEQEFNVLEGTYSDESKYPGWPKSVGFKFGDFEKEHLSMHDAINVTPGGSGFGICNPIHNEWRLTWKERIE